MIYANFKIQQQRLDGGCGGRIQLTSGSGADKSASSLLALSEGALFTTPTEQTNFLQFNTCPGTTSVTDITPSSGGSMVFVAGGPTVQTNVSYPNDANLRIGTQNFTIEWFQFYQDSDANAIVFSIGTFPTNNICVVYVGTRLYLFVQNTAYDVLSAVTKNIWQHVALVGNGSSIKVYVGGSLKLTVTVTYNLVATDILRIGNQTDASVPNGNYAGRITNFRWVVGTAIYNSDFSPPTAPLTAVTGTQLLLLASNESNVVKDSSGAGRTATNTGVNFSSSSPF